MKQLTFLLSISLICGCSFIVGQDEDLKTIGISKDAASELSQEIERQRPDKLTEIHIMQENKTIQVKEPEPVTRRIK